MIYFIITAVVLQFSSPISSCQLSILLSISLSLPTNSSIPFLLSYVYLHCCPFSLLYTHTNRSLLLLVDPFFWSFPLLLYMWVNGPSTPSPISLTLSSWWKIGNYLWVSRKFSQVFLWSIRFSHLMRTLLEPLCNLQAANTASSPIFFSFSFLS